MANILLLEKRAAAREVLVSQIVAEDGWFVFSAQSADEAVSLMRSGPIDLIVAELGATGEACVELIEAASPIPVIVTSARDRQEGLIDALEAGAANYIPTHFFPDRLAGAIRAALSSALKSSKRTKLLGAMAFSHSQFSIPTDLSMLSVAAERMQASLEMFGLCDPSQTMHVRIALDEALANAFYHGNLGVTSDLKESDDGDFECFAQQRLLERPYCDRRIEIEEHLTREEARFTIRDEGAGFNANELPDPTDQDRLTRCSGRGIAMMRYFLDEVIYNQTGNQVTLVKRGPVASPQCETRTEMSVEDDSPDKPEAASTLRPVCVGCC